MLWNSIFSVHFLLSHIAQMLLVLTWLRFGFVLLCESETRSRSKVQMQSLCHEAWTSLPFLKVQLLWLLMMKVTSFNTKANSMRIRSWDCQWCNVYACFIDKSHFLSVCKIDQCTMSGDDLKWLSMIKICNKVFRNQLKVHIENDNSTKWKLLPRYFPFVHATRLTHSNRLNLCMRFVNLVNTMQQRENSTI